MYTETHTLTHTYPAFSLGDWDPRESLAVTYWIIPKSFLLTSEGPGPTMRTHCYRRGFLIKLATLDRSLFSILGGLEWYSPWLPYNKSGKNFPLPFSCCGSVPESAMNESPAQGQGTIKGAMKRKDTGCHQVFCLLLHTHGSLQTCCVCSQAVLYSQPGNTQNTPSLLILGRDGKPIHVSTFWPKVTYFSYFLEEISPAFLLYRFLNI